MCLRTAEPPVHSGFGVTHDALGAVDPFAVLPLAALQTCWRRHHLPQAPLPVPCRVRAVIHRRRLKPREEHHLDEEDPPPEEAPGTFLLVGGSFKTASVVIVYGAAGGGGALGRGGAAVGRGAWCLPACAC